MRAAPRKNRLIVREAFACDGWRQTQRPSLQVHRGMLGSADAAPAREPQQSTDEQIAESVGEEGAAEELDGVPVLVGALAHVDLPQICGKFGLLVFAAGDIFVRSDHFTPGLEAGDSLSFYGDAGGLALFGAGLLVKADAEQFEFELFDFGGFGGGDGAEQAADAVEGAVGIVGAEGALVRPAVASFAEFADEGTLGGTKGFAENVVPLVPDGEEEGLGIPLGAVGSAKKLHLGGGQIAARFLEPALLVGAL